MLGGLFLILAITLQTGQVEGKSSHVKGWVKSVFVERSTDGDSGTRVPWYRERYDDRSRLAELIFLKDDGLVTTLGFMSMPMAINWPKENYMIPITYCNGVSCLVMMKKASFRGLGCFLQMVRRRLSTISGTTVSVERWKR